MHIRSRTIASLALTALAVPLLLAATTPPPVHSRDNRVVLVVSSAGRDSGRTHPGFEMDELAQAWLVFRSNGFDVTIASPAGGAVVADPFDRTAAYNDAFLSTPSAAALLAGTAPTANLRAQDYAALMVIGGKGAMFDLPGDTALARLAGEMHDLGAIVSAVCHGPAGLLRARTRAGAPLVAGRAMTGFTNEEELVFGKTWRSQYAFLLEDEARRLGARWEEAPLMLPHVTVDGNLITGQNPFSTAVTAETVVRSLGRTPVAREPWRDERAVYAAAEYLTVPMPVAQRRLAADWKALHVDVIGLLGYYQLQVVGSDADAQRALTLMELASPYMPQPELSLGLVTAYRRLGRFAEARAVADDLAARYPEHAKAARALLERSER
jgi:putative intracellular protease/amidase